MSARREEKSKLLIGRAALLRGFGQVAGDVGCKLIEVWGGMGAVTRVVRGDATRREIVWKSGPSRRQNAREQGAARD
jgi:hypothetical protein